MLVRIRDWFRLIADPRAIELPLAQRWALVVASALALVLGGAIAFGVLAVIPWVDTPSGEMVRGWLMGAWTAAFIMESRRLILVPDKQRRPGHRAERIQAE